MSEKILTKLTGNDDLTHCYQIRRQVFIEGQNVPEDLEIDGLDIIATHYLLWVNEQPVGTARVRFPQPNQAKIERVAILFPYQGQGLGTKLMTDILADLQQQPLIMMAILGAQISALGFYQKLGFIAYGEPFWEAGILHQWMKRQLS